MFVTKKALRGVQVDVIENEISIAELYERLFLLEDYLEVEYVKDWDEESYYKPIKKSKK